MNVRRKRMLNLGFWVLIVVLIAGIIGGITYMIREGGGSLPVEGQAPNFTATNVTGKTISFDSLNGKVRLVTWFYTHCPDECPLTAYHMEQIQNQLEKEGKFGNKVVFVSITFDPTRDTLPVIQAWANHFQPDYKGWYFLRATPEQTKEILREWGIQVKPGATPGYLEHVVKTDLIDQNGNIRKVYNTADLNTNEVVSNINNLIAKSSWS